MDEATEMEARREYITDDVFDPGVAETSIGLPDVPISELRSTDLDMENFVDSVRKDLHLGLHADPMTEACVVVLPQSPVEYYIYFENIVDYLIF